MSRAEKRALLQSINYGPWQKEQTTDTEYDDENDYEPYESSDDYDNYDYDNYDQNNYDDE